MIYLCCIIVFALAYSIKGGWLGLIPGWNAFVRSHPITDLFLDGTRLSWLLVLVLSLFLLPWQTALLFTLAWAYSSSSLGEEIGAVGDYKKCWGPYIDKGFGQAYGVKKALQWGLAWGGLMALATGYIWFIPAAATFPIVYFIGSSLYRLIHNEGSWSYAEPLYGAVIGLAYMGYVYGYS